MHLQANTVVFAGTLYKTVYVHLNESGSSSAQKGLSRCEAAVGMHTNPCHRSDQLTTELADASNMYSMRYGAN